MHECLNEFSGFERVALLTAIEARDLICIRIALRFCKDTLIVVVNFNFESASFFASLK